MAQEARSAGAETSDKTEPDAVGAQVAITSTNPKTGTYAYLLQYLKALADPPVNNLTFTGFTSHKDFISHFDIRLEQIPAQPIQIWNHGSVTLEINSAGKLFVGTTVGTTVLSTATYYRIEVLGDKTVQGKVFVRINGVDEFSVTDSTSGTQVIFGGNGTKTNDSNCNARMDNVTHIAFTAGEVPYWVGATPLHYRTYNSAGNHNDYAGTGDVTNKYNNIDDYAPHTSDTDYNQGGALDVTKRQSHNPLDVTPSGTLKAFTVYGSHKGIVTAGFTAGTDKMIIRDNSVDYLTAFSGATSYVVTRNGYAERPGGGALSAAILNAIEAGSQTLISSFSFTENPILGFMPVEAYVNLNPNADSSTGDDGVWKDETGSATGSAYSKLDSSTATWMEHNATGVPQGIKVPAPSVTGGVITGVSICVQGGDPAAGTTDVRGYFKTGGTRYSTAAKTFSSGSNGHVFATWNTNPATGVAWTAANISGGEFGIEIVSFAGGSTEFDAYWLFLAVGVVSQLRETSYWMVTAHGDAPVEVTRATSYVSLRSMMGIGS